MTPRERQRLAALLRAATSTGVASIDAWQSLPDDFDLDEIWDRELGRLLPSIGRNLSDAGADVPELPRLRGFQRKWWVEQQLTARWLAEPIDVLASAGLDVAVAGGLAWSANAWGYADRPGVRWADDTHLLVRADDAVRAHAALVGVGAHGRPEERVARRVRLHVGTPLHVDERWTTLGWLPTSGVRRTADWWTDTVEIEVGERQAHALEPNAAFVARCGDLAAGIDVPSALLDLCRVRQSATFDRSMVRAVAGRWGLDDAAARWSTVVDQVLDPTDDRWIDAVAPIGRLEAARRSWSTTVGRLGRRRAVAAGPELLAERWHLSHVGELPAGLARRLRDRTRRFRGAA
ncbi:putative nucleotidyltransferase-like protein [Ilumatobacter fluminis]|uniref:Putative nucleotidyltransferase-like protein n=1 Tax=Ilumatobacter fluminis TaxID=467091 RepID=A0A4R7HY04_9ACTN|nr:nucleotidyltransferase family protein [Ilumatobacter fluminis]TDT15630.1 putative nucleotidyltransferase-like protein [Ilumatobacter fluminis]